MPINASSTSPRVIQIRSGVPVAPRSRRGLSEALQTDPITRVEWDAIVSSGRDPMEWYDRLPPNQRRLPTGVAEFEAGARFRVSSNLTVIR